MNPCRERLVAPVSWWIAASVFGLVCGWIMLVATTWTIGIVAAVTGAVLAGAVVWGYGSVVVEAGPDGLTVGGTTLPIEHVGRVQVLDRRGFGERLGSRADARAWMRTRPYIEGGVEVEVADPDDPTPYWLISCRRPRAVAAALGQTEGAPSPAPRRNGDVHGGEEEAEEG